MDTALPNEAAPGPDPAGERAQLDWTAAAELTIAQASEVHAQWLQLLETRPARLSLALAAVEEFDSAGVQLLLSLTGSAARWDCECRIVSCSGAVRRALADYRLKALLDPFCSEGGPEAAANPSEE